jgi:hypothetical protein
MTFQSNDLTKAEGDLVNEILVQIPEDHGARAAFQTILEKLDARKPKFRFVGYTEEGYWIGTNDPNVAEEWEETCSVLNTETGQDEYGVDAKEQAE